MANERIVGLQAGTAGRNDLQNAIETAWHELLSDADDSRRVADILGISRDQLAPVHKAPFNVESAGSGFGALEVAYVVGIWIGSEIVLGALRDLAKEELKRRLRELWDKVLSKRMRNVLDKEQVGSDVDLDRTG